MFQELNTTTVETPILTPKLNAFLCSPKLKWPKKIDELNHFLSNKTKQIWRYNLPWL